MKRDMDLIRLLMMEFTGEDVKKQLKAWKPRTRAYHVAMLKDAGYVEAVIGVDEYGCPARSIVIRVTWQGHEFIDVMKNETLWGRVKKATIEKAVPYSAAMLLQIGKAYAKDYLPEFSAE